MASTSPQGHLDATAGRDVVYCHACENEWYQDEHGLQCPRCQSEATEIVTAENDPRSHHQDSSPSDYGGQGRHTLFPSHDTDSDPDEGDIEEHIRTGPGGFFMRQTVFRSPSRPGSDSPGPGGRGPIDPSEGDVILQRFRDMLTQDFRVGQPGRSGPDTLFPPAGDAGMLFGGQPRAIHRTTFSGPGFSGGTASFTITAGPIHRGGQGGQGMGPSGMDFDSVFGNLMANSVPPPNVGNGRGPFPPPLLAASLQEILASLLNPHNAIHGDAVYSQEALDRIITTLMDANPQSNAAPPASQAAIDGLQRKELDDEMLGPEGKAECTICIDEMRKGDQVVVLPCKHWFHDECVVLWLKEHNTCPICRQPIEGGGRPSGDGAAAQQQGAQRQEASSVPLSTSAFMPAGRIRRERPPRTASENEERLNAIRNAAGRPRRSSMSPPSPRSHHQASENPSRTRIRSPSFSSREREQSASRHHGSPHPDDTRRASGASQGQQGASHSGGSHGALAWIRDQFNRHSGSGSGGGRGHS